ncbi:hypothetical protein ACLOJK_022243 [Asimina triloba]
MQHYQEAHIVETVDWKQKHKAMKEEICGLKEAGLRREMETSIMKKNKSIHTILICIIVVMAAAVSCFSSLKPTSSSLSAVVNGNLAGLYLGLVCFGTRTGTRLSLDLGLGAGGKGFSK